ncbi:hypothetical protein Metlim_1234 [Methanoplanus limicola DSM 2279]|uniref:Uncharacterized protein n=1 Tax=Methanoplanus limicola DSM 2279 TaxID=937775 RepID=H1Z177_9EURY|nr:hypothetical protein Metlim_1234 [Methanoplanus limicola DSM 2279]
MVSVYEPKEVNINPVIRSTKILEIYPNKKADTPIEQHKKHSWYSGRNSDIIDIQYMIVRYHPYLIYLSRTVLNFGGTVTYCNLEL